MKDFEVVGLSRDENGNISIAAVESPYMEGSLELYSLLAFGNFESINLYDINISNTRLKSFEPKELVDISQSAVNTQNTVEFTQLARILNEYDDMEVVLLTEDGVIGIDYSEDAWDIVCDSSGMPIQRTESTVSVSKFNQDVEDAPDEVVEVITTLNWLHTSYLDEIC